MPGGISFDIALYFSHGLQYNARSFLKYARVMTDLNTTEQKACYGIGRQVGQQLSQQSFKGMDPDAIALGLVHELQGADLAVSHEDINAALTEISNRMRAAQEEAAKAAAVDGENYLAENAKRSEVTVTESGLQYEVLSMGTGEVPSASATVRTHYRGTLTDGKQFDSSYDRGQPAEFPVKGVIAGWTEALQLMPVGSKWRLHIPYQLAYGERGAGADIPPYAALVFDIELLDIV